MPSASGEIHFTTLRKDPINSGSAAQLDGKLPAQRLTAEDRTLASTAQPALVIRNFRMDVDAVWLYDLWHRTLHCRWAVTHQAIFHIINDADLLLVAECEGTRSGFCAVDSLFGVTAALVLLLVDPARQKRGIGTELLKSAQAALKKQKVGRLNLGAGNRSYFWPGLPDEHDEAWPFFAKRGFQEQEASEDLILALADFQTPAWVSARQRSTGTTFCLADPVRAVQINAFEQKYFPAWAPYFKNEMRQDGFKNILIAEGTDHKIHGTVLMKANASTPWQDAGSIHTGALNTLGVAPERQGRGIGLALTAKAMEHLRQRGCTFCYIQWTGLADWYGKLGAKPWAHYRMAYKPL